MRRQHDRLPAPGARAEIAELEVAELLLEHRDGLAALAHPARDDPSPLRAREARLEDAADHFGVQLEDLGRAHPGECHERRDDSTGGCAGEEVERLAGLPAEVFLQRGQEVERHDAADASPSSARTWRFPGSKGGKDVGVSVMGFRQRSAPPSR